MKRNKRLAILGGVLAACCAVTFAVMQIEEHQEKIKNTDEVILQIPADTVKSLSWKYDDTSLKFTRGETWKWDEDDAFPVDEEKINQLLGIFENLGAAFVIDDVEDYSQYGLDQPVCTIDLATEDKDYEVLLGDYSTMDAQRYVSIGDGKVYLVNDDPYETYETTIENLILQDSTPSLDKTKKITFAGVEAYTISYEEETTDSYCAEDHYFTEIDGNKLSLDSDKVRDYVDSVSLMDLSSYVSYNATEEELEKYGLATPELTTTVEYIATDDDGNESDETFVIKIGRNKEELAAKEAAEAKGEEYDGTVTCYARVADSKILYQISESEYNTLRNISYNDLRHADVMTADFADITQIDITLEDKESTITIAEAPKDSDAEYVYTYGDTEVDGSNLKSKVKALTVTEFKDETPSDKEEIAMTFHLNNEKFPEVKVSLYRYDGSSCLAVLDGETLGLVDRSAVVDLIEAVNAIVLG